MPKVIELVGARFGKLIVIECVGKDKIGNKIYKCKCDCGNEKNVIAVNLIRKDTKSCGCARHTGEFGTTHGMNHTRIYSIWTGMKSRCLNANQKSYKDYGARGITVCDKWLKFDGFYEDMGESYIHGLTLDRKNGEGNYELSNCRWATYTEQGNNTRHNRFLEFNGETDTLANLCRKYNKNYGTIKSRLKYGWTTEKAFTQEVRK